MDGEWGFPFTSFPNLSPSSSVSSLNRIGHLHFEKRICRILLLGSMLSGRQFKLQKHSGISISKNQVITFQSSGTSNQERHQNQILYDKIFRWGNGEAFEMSRSRLPTCKFGFCQF